MKQPKRLTRNQKECVSAHHLKVSDWMLVMETEFYLYLINKEGTKTKRVDKFIRGAKRK